MARTSICVTHSYYCKCSICNCPFYNTGSGQQAAYSHTGNFYTSDYSNPPLVAPRTPASGAANGRYYYDSSLHFPDSTYGYTNYWIGVTFSDTFGGSAVTATPALKAVDLAEYAPGLIAEVKASPSTDILDVTGKASIVISERVAVTDFEALSIDGYSPEIPFDIRVFPPKEGLSIDGYDSTVRNDAKVFPATEGLTVTGYTPSVTTQTASSAQPGKATVVVEGYAPTLSPQIVARPAVESLSVDGYTPLAQQIISVYPLSSALLVDGYTVDTARISTLIPATEELVARGYNPSITVTDISFKMGMVRAAVNTSTGNQTFTADLGGVVPSAAIIVLTSATTDGTPASDAILSIGITDGSNHACLLNDSEDGQSTTDTKRNHYSDRLVQVNDPGTVNSLATGAFASFSSNSLTINWTDAPPSAYLLTAILFGGTEISAKVDSIVTGASETTSTYSSAGLTMNAGFFMMAGLAIDDDSDSGRPCLGFVDGSGTNKGIGINWVNGQGTSQNYGYLASDQAIAQMGAALEYSIQITNITSSGFDHCVHIGNAAGDYFSFLAMEVPKDVKVGTITLPAATSVASFSGLGFAPGNLLLLASNMTAADTEYSDSAGSCLGIIAMDGSGTYSNVVTDQDAVGTTVTRSLSDNQIRMLNHDGSTNTALGTLTSFDADGFTWNLSTSTSGALWHYLAFAGEPPAVTAGTFYRCLIGGWLSAYDNL